MDEILYLEPDEEITSVVDKLKGLEAKSVGLVAPKGSSIVQSLVSLKLLQKQAKEEGKQIAIITSDEVGQNLASRIELPVYADVRSKKPIEPINQKVPEETGPIEITDEPAVETEDLAIAKKAEKSPEKTVQKGEEIPEEYKDLPKSFEVHRYDQAKEPASEEAEDISPAEDLEEEQGPVETEEEEVKQDSNARFVNRPLKEKKVDNRMELEHAKPMINERRVFASSGRSSRKKLIVTIFSVILLILALLLADLALAKLEINITVPAEEISKDVIISVEKDHPAVDLENSVIGGTQTDKEVANEGSYPSTGEKETGDKAKGTLTFKNDAGVDESISAGTTVRSSSGVEFTTDSNFTVPKATLNSAGDKVLGQATSAVTAKEAGSGGNLSSSSNYVISGKSKISISGATSGGTTRKVKIVTKSDIDAAKKDLQEKAVSKFKEDLKTDKKTLFIDDAVKADLAEFTTSKNTGEEADNFKANAKIKIVTITFMSDDFNQAVTKAAETGLPEGKSLLITETDSITPVLEENMINVGKLKIKGQLRSHVGPKLDINQKVGAYRLKPIKNIKADLEKIEGVKVNSLNISPSFALPLGPILKKNTHFKVEYTGKQG